MDDSVATHADDQHVLIIGGGIAGLASALRVRALDPSCRVTILEATARVGGKIAGETVDGCVVDGGADVCIGDRFRQTHMFEELGLASRVIRVNPNELPTYERRDGPLTEFPTRFAGELLTFPRGLHDLVDLASSALNGVAVITDTPVGSIRTDNGAWLVEPPVGVQPSTGDAATADAVIVATPASQAATLLSPFVPDQAAALRSLECPATTTVTMAWRLDDVPRALDGTGYLASGGTSRVSACTWVSSKNPTHARPGIALLRGYIRGTDRNAAALMREEVATTAGITAAPLFTRIYEWPEGIPLYTRDYEGSIVAISERLDALAGLFIAGSAFHGIGIPDCIASGERAAEAAVAYLAGRHTEEVA
jgi:protoporphyrinogen oxidase